MKPGDKIYLISNLDVYAKILNTKIMNSILHFNIIIHRGTSKTKSCLSRTGLETFYQSSQTPKRHFLIVKFKALLTHQNPIYKPR